MSTDFLNRRMDLAHSLVTRVGDTPNKSILTMDTSYPVKLAGKVIKLFNAADRFYANMTWEIRNSIEELILTIQPDHVYDFAGIVLDSSNVGEGKYYASGTEVFVTDDYVMAIIDFDNASIHLCSETNFSKFGKADANIKIFTIDGSVNPEDTNYKYENVDYKYDDDILNDAINFEAEDDKYALARFENGDEKGLDYVLYEHPTTMMNGTQKLGYSLIPVAKVDTFNINDLYASVSRFMFPYQEFYGSKRGNDTSITDIAAFMTISGSLTNKFVEDFCFTESEMLALPMVVNAPQHIKDKLLEMYNLIDNHDEYYYVLSCLIDLGGSGEDSAAVFSTQYWRDEDEIKFIPIKISDNSFASLFKLQTRGIIVNGNKVDLAQGMDNRWDCVGALEEDDIKAGYLILHYGFGLGFRYSVYDEDDKICTDSNGQYDIIDVNTIADDWHNYTFSLDADNRINQNTSEIFGPDDNKKPTNYDLKYQTTYGIDTTDNEIKQYFEGSSINNYMARVARFMRFFIASETQYRIEGNFMYSTNNAVHTTYLNDLTTHTTEFANLNNYAHHNTDNDMSIIIEPLATSVIEYPETFTVPLFTTADTYNPESFPDKNYTNYTEYGATPSSKIVIDQSNRAKVRFKNRVSPRNHYHNMSVIYSLFNTKNLRGSIYNSEGQLKKVGMSTNYAGESTVYTDVNYVYDAARTCSDDGIHTMFSYTDNTKKKMHMVSFVSIASLNYLGDNDATHDHYKNAEVTTQSMLVYKNAKKASEYITIDNNGNLEYSDGSLSRSLFIVKEQQNGETPDFGTTAFSFENKNYIYKYANVNDTYLNFKSAGTDTNGKFIYMYYMDGTAGANYGLHRIKYYYRNSARDIDAFDYFTDEIVMNNSVLYTDPSNKLDSVIEWCRKLNSRNTNNVYVKAIANYYASLNAGNTENGMYAAARASHTVGGSTVVDTGFNFAGVAVIVSAVYGFCMNGLTISGDTVPFKFYKSDRLSSSNTINLTVDIDEKIIYPGRANTETNSVSKDQRAGIRLKQMVGSNFNYKIEKNMMPATKTLSKDSYGSWVYNVSSYTDYISKTTMPSYVLDTNCIKDIAGDGIELSHYAGKAVDFMADCLTGDLAKPSNEKGFGAIYDSNGVLGYKFIKHVEIKDRGLFYKKAIIGYKNGDYEIGGLDHYSIKAKPWASVSGNYEWIFKKKDDDDLSGDPRNSKLFEFGNRVETHPETGETGIVLKSNIDPNNLFGLHKITLIKYLNQDALHPIDVTNEYVDSTKMAWINKEQTGKRTTYSPSLAKDGDLFNSEIVSLSGTDGVIDLNDITWKDLSVALSSNFTIDILSDSLKSIKTDLNSNFLNNVQNVSDTITMEQEYESRRTAESRSDPSWPFPRDTDYRYREFVAEFDENYNIYNYNYGYGYEGPKFYRYRIPNNRGVIVFITENGKSFMYEGSGATVDDYRTTTPKLSPKRMYINNDGILCTKEFFDRDVAQYKVVNGEIQFPAPVSLAALYKRILCLETALRNANIPIPNPSTIDFP